MFKRGLFTCAVLGIATSAFAGMRIDLRPDGLTVNPGNPPSVVAGPGNYNVQVFLVDTGNDGIGNIGFRGLFLDSADTTGIVAGPTYNWVNPFGIGAVFPNLPNTSWVYPLPTANPLFQNVLPDGGEVLIGNLNVANDADGGLLDMTNGDNSDANFGARADFGFGGAGDPVTTWRAFTGEITGGKLAFVPEPASLVLLAAGAIAVIRRRRTA